MALDKAERHPAIGRSLFVYPYLLRDLVAQAFEESEAKEGRGEEQLRPRELLVGLH